MTKLAFVFILFVLFANAEINDQSFDVNAHDDFVKSAFGRLLKSIVTINEQRYDAMKKLTKLQDSNVAMDNLRNGMNSDEGHGHLLVVLGEDNSPKHKAKRLLAKKLETSDATDFESAEVETDDLVREQENVLRVWKSCQKKAAKVCRKACVDAYRTTCSEYACSRKMKKTLKKECKVACKNRFH